MHVRPGFGRTAVGGLAVLAAAALLMAACGGDDSYDSNSSKPAAGGSATGAAAQTDVKVRDAGSLGKVLTDKAGLTLYTFNNDTPGSGKSSCTADCAATWPAAQPAGAAATKAADVSGALTIISRDDGAKQLAYQGRPLYRFAADKAPGDAGGQGIGGVWFAAKADAPAGGSATPTKTSGGYNY